MKSSYLFLCLVLCVLLLLLATSLTHAQTGNNNHTNNDMNDKENEALDEVRGNKQLNNLLSMAIDHARKSGEIDLLDERPNIRGRGLQSINCDCTRRFMSQKHFNVSLLVGPMLRIYQSQTLIIGLPMPRIDSDSFFYDANGVPQGNLVDIGHLITHHMGLTLGTEIKAKFMTYQARINVFNVSIGVLDRGEADTIIGFRYTLARSRYVDFTCCFRDSFYWVAYREATSPLPDGANSPRSISDLNKPELIVGVLRGTISESVIRKYLWRTRKVMFDDQFAMNHAVGRSIHFILSDEMGVGVYNADHGNRLVPIPNTRVAYAGGYAFITKKF